jgi:hypothetical protein
MAFTRISLSQALAVALLGVPGLVAEDCHVVPGSSGVLTLLGAIDSDTLVGSVPLQARLISEIGSGQNALPAADTIFVLNVSPAPYRDEIRADVALMILAGAAFDDLEAEVSAVAAKGVSVSAGVIRRTRRLLFHTFSGPVRLPPGTKITIRFKKHRVFPCERNIPPKKESNP